MATSICMLLLTALPALAGRAGGEVVSVTEGAGPKFAPHQLLALVAAAGQPATLHCRVLRLADKAVSWVRSRDLQILTHAGTVFTADARVSAEESAAGGGAGAAATRHSLHLERLRLSDSGRYECQVNTEPKMSLFFNLTVLDEPVPSVVVSVVGEGVVRADEGGAGTLACEARYSPAPRALPVPPLDIRWWRDSDSGAAPLSLQSSRGGGVSLDTERWAARVVSRLTLADVRAADATRYTCTAGGGAGGGGGGGGGATSATLRLVLYHPEERMEMQRDQAGSGGGGRGGGGGRSLAALLPLAALCIL